MTDGDNLILGSANAASGQTFLLRDGTVITALAVANTNGGAVVGTSTTHYTGVEGGSDTGAGVSGAANSGVGVFGTSPDGAGVVGSTLNGTALTGQSLTGTGLSATSTSGGGVLGTSTSGTGVRGQSQTGPGVVGVSQTNVGLHGESPVLPGVVGRCSATTTQTAGVMGIGDGLGSGVAGTSLLGNGVQAFSQDSDAVTAVSLRKRGVVGTALGNTGASVGVHGVAPFPVSGPPVSNVGVVGEARHGIGVFGVTDVGFAGLFMGRVGVIGNFTVVGTKSAAVALPDGSRRLTYAIESPESWLEDFGRAQLVSGRSTVPLDPTFAAAIDTHDYHVFLTPEADCLGLHVGARTPDAFEVREMRDGTENLSFSYRIVGRRRDVTADRFAPFTMPEVPDLPQVTDLDQPTAPPGPGMVVPPPLPDIPTSPPDRSDPV